MTFVDLLLEHLQYHPYRPYRLETESVADYKAYLGTRVPPEPLAADLVPPLSEFADFAETLTRARLTNVERDVLEVQYRVGLWDDAWNGFFYYPALAVSHKLSYDQRLPTVPSFENELRYFYDVRAHRHGRYLFLKKGAFWASFAENAVSLPVEALSRSVDDPNLAEVAAVFGTNLVSDLCRWTGISQSSAASPHPQESAIGRAYDVFIGHSSADAQQARELADALTHAGKRVFFSPQSLPELGSSDYMKTIDDAIEQSTHFILVATSRENIVKTWVEAEWRTFINEKRSGRKSGNFLTVVPATLSPSDLPLALRYYEVVPWQAGLAALVASYLT